MNMRSSLYSAREECLLCGNAIANPICHACIEHEIDEWLAGRMPKLVPRLKKAGEALRSYTRTGTRCILCSNNMNVCTHCYCYEVNRLFDNYPKLAEEFIEMFNFELRGSAHINVIE